LILLSKTQKRHFNSIKSAKSKIKKIKGKKFGEKLNGKSQEAVKGDKIKVIDT
jgi:hypothetical protein